MSLHQLQEMGFSEEKAQDALSRCDNDLPRAIAYLFGDNAGNDELDTVGISNPTLIPTELFPENSGATNDNFSPSSAISISTTSSSSSLSPPSLSSSSFPLDKNLLSRRYDLFLNVLAVTSQIPLFKRSVLLWPTGEEDNDEHSSIGHVFKNWVKTQRQSAPTAVLDSLLQNCVSSFNLDDDFEENVVALFKTIAERYEMERAHFEPSETDDVSIGNSSPTTESLAETKDTAASDKLDSDSIPGSDELAPTALNREDSSNKLSTADSGDLKSGSKSSGTPHTSAGCDTPPPLNPASLLSSTVESSGGVVRSEVYLLPISLENRSHTIQQSLSNVFWGDEEVRGKLNLAKISPLICVQLPSVESTSYQFTKKDNVVHPGAFSGSLTLVVEDMYRQSAQADIDRSNATRRAMGIASFEGKRVKALLNDCLEYANKSKPALTEKVNQLIQVYERQVEHGQREIAEFEHIHASMDPSDFANIERHLPQVAKTAVPFTLVGVIIALRQFYVLECPEQNTWTRGLQGELHGEDSSLPFSGVLLALNDKSKLGEWGDGHNLLFYANEEGLKQDSRSVLDMGIDVGEISFNQEETVLHVTPKE